MAYFARHFTLAEANGLVPWVRSVLDRARLMLATLDEDEEVAAPPPDPAADEGNGHGQEPAEAEAGAEIIQLDEVWRELGRDERIELVNGLLAALTEEGIVIQDTVRGLIDFPALRPDGSEILLCWEPADGPAVTHWHALEAGYAGRRPISELNEDT